MKNWNVLAMPSASSGDAAAAPKGSNEVDIDKLEIPSLVPKKQEAKPSEVPKLQGGLLSNQPTLKKVQEDSKSKLGQQQQQPKPAAA